MRPSHIIFDLDGTLVDSLLDLSAATNHTLRHLGLRELPPHRVRDYVGEGARELVRRAIGPEAAPRFDEALAVFLHYYGEHVLDRTQPYPGIVTLLQTLAGRGICMTVLTNKPIAMTTAILDGLQLSPYFAATLGGDSLPTRKPDPSGVEWLLQHTATTREQTVLAGDSPVDRETASNAQVRFCAVGWGLGSAHLRAAGTRPIFESPDELATHLQDETHAPGK